MERKLEDLYEPTIKGKHICILVTSHSEWEALIMARHLAREKVDVVVVDHRNESIDDSLKTIKDIPILMPDIRTHLISHRPKRLYDQDRRKGYHFMKGKKR